ncbi:helix-turn-helix transcriptional regulator [Mycobacterium parmense]|uniref:Transcriptional regulator n=1 Tax=Mycobacterium parmense TaxID=185642 RepID=A0A7I7YXS4_9MYCO|nr:LuxR family transcriptional regulator [Mycobacterium parmense]MCV7352708.1 helix-turn-helix domain-containing protein [Mycobacterium parmense]ORW54624.1 helix-turn-helix transcriptional regulator [Mycobacterium parmense]BBZ46715.1 transcriptional regulator [Mycobacterium parmense]
MAGSWQLLDRPVEQQTIRAALTGVDGCGVLVIGAAGVGKTTLARTVTKALATPVHWAACTETSRGIPLGAFAQWVGSTGARDPIALLSQARGSIVSSSDAVIGVDDAHLLDQLSATLLHQIAAEGAGHIVATVRSGEPVPDAVTSLWKDGYMERLDLQPFSKQQSIALVETVLGGTLEELSAEVMWEASGGNPLFLRHLVEGALEANTLSSVNGVWQLRGPTTVSAGFADLLEDRFKRAGEAAVRALELLALCEPLEIGTLSDLAGEAAVDAAEAQGLLRIVRDGNQVNARISHPLYGEVIRRRIGTASARKLRGRIVTELSAQGIESAAERIRLAQLSIDSDKPPDNDLLVAAAKDAVFLANLPLGEQLARSAFERGDGLRAAELLSRALLWQGRPREADAILASFEPDNLDELQLVLWGIPRLSILFWSMGQVQQAHEVLALLNRRVTHPALRLIVEATGAAMAVHENRFDTGLPAAEAVLSNPDAPKQAVDFAAFAAGLALPVAGRGSEYEPIAARCRAEQKPTDGMIRVMVRYCDVLALTHTGQLDQADRRVAEYTQFSSEGQFLGWAIAKIAAGLVATYRGDFPGAISSIEQALAALNAETSLPWRLPGRLLLARAYAALGQTGQAERVLNDATEHTGRQVELHEPQRMIAEAWLKAAAGGERTAAEAARRAAQAARQAGQYALEAEALHHAARFGDRGVAEPLAALVPELDGSVAKLYLRHATAVADADADALDAVSGDFENAGLLLSAADAAAQAVPMHDQAGQRRRSAESAGRALHLAALCGGAITPAIRSAARPLPLSPREREIASMIAEGLSNREIARRLHVSVRTVEGHIYRACIKLDVSDRDDLAAIVAGSPRS